MPVRTSTFENKRQVPPYKSLSSSISSPVLSSLVTVLMAAMPLEKQKPRVPFSNEAVRDSQPVPQSRIKVGMCGRRWMGNQRLDPAKAFRTGTQGDVVEGLDCCFVACLQLKRD